MILKGDFKKFPLLKTFKTNNFMKTYNIDEFQTPKKKNNFKHYFFKFGTCLILGFLLGCIGIDFYKWEFWAVVVPLGIFDTFRDAYFNI